MEKELMYLMIQGQVSYEFKDPNLLTQALTRKSYSQENGGTNNEVLEFIGDKVLDIAVVNYLANKYGNVEQDGFCSQLDEGELTRLKARMVEKKNLAKRIDELGFSDFIRMGKGDAQNKINQELSVKEDLFEAILGAVAIDCNWDYNRLFEVVEIMLNPDTFDKSDSEKNYVDLIIEHETKKWHVVPYFKIYERAYTTNWFAPYDGITQKIDQLKTNVNRLQYTCLLKLLTDIPQFVAFGTSKNDARKQACKLAYEWLEKEDLLWSIYDEIDNPNKDEAINQLEILARRGYFSIPEYNFKQNYDKDGNPIWNCECSIKKCKKSFKSKSSSKKNAKKSCAFKMLKYVLEEM